MKEPQHAGNNQLGVDGLCRDCVHRRAYLALGNVLRASEILLVAGLPSAWTVLEARGHFKLDPAWVTLYIAGVLALTAGSFGWQWRAIPPSIASEPESKE
jgi:hypothetical protein